MIQIRLKKRKINRLINYNYSKGGYYFVTICTKNKEEFFGNIKDKKMILNEIGLNAKKYWEEIPKHFSEIKLDKYIIMPDHVHGILIIKNFFVIDNKFVNKYSGVLHLLKTKELLKKRQYQKLPIVIGSYKSAVTKNVNKLDRIINFQWQRSFYDNIIFDEKTLNSIRKYITENPLRWSKKN